jgi:hypothetical protein
MMRIGPARIVAPNFTGTIAVTIMKRCKRIVKKHLPIHHHLLRPRLRRIITGIVGSGVAVYTRLPFAKLWQTALFLSKTSFLTSWPKIDRVKAIIRNLKITPCFAMANIV